MTEQKVEEREIPAGALEFAPQPGDYFAEVLREHDVDIAFGVHGGDLWFIVDPMSRAGIKIITVHHEQTAVYAAEAYAKVTGKPGVVFVDTGPGSANIASGLQQAHLSCSPVVVISGGPIVGHDRAYTIQPTNTEHMYSHITKWTQRITYPHQVKRILTKALKDCQTYPKGPVVVEFPLFALNGPIPPPSLNTLFAQHSLYLDKWRGDETSAPLPQTQGDPAAVERIVKRIYEAKNPLIFAGDGVHWSRASSELVEFAELGQVPCAGRRIARGAIPEVHPLFFTSRIHAQAFAECDLLVLIGMKMGFFDGNFAAGWPKAIQINESEDHIFTFVNTELALVGTPKLVLRQMIDCARANNLKPPAERAEWVSKLQDMHRAAEERLMARAEKYKDYKPVHHGWLCKAIWDACEELHGGMNRVMIDGYTISSFVPPFIKARYSGQVMDASEQAGVGHGIGMAIGAALGDPEAKKHPIVSLMGDAGMGNSAMDIETAVRFELPIVFVVTNNDGWLGGMKAHYYGKNWEVLGEQDRPYGQCFIPDIKYEKLSEVFSCHGEYVAEPSEFRPALERAFSAAEGGKPAVVNVIVDPTLVNLATYSNPGYPALWAHIPWKELPKRGKALRRFCLGQLVPLFPFDQYGIPPVEPPDPWEPISEEEMMP